ncbi:MlaD family protein [Pedosphaera parvula]|uniref:Mammalian cell entry related domain protein n=1 Tax=Pedosphaera parvula (strain Ellin514) TaxID=320771 RepID=B9XGL6_PEDPL|nr:MlaD family protein [Pedosphaera parvula]EEF61067.1 Mammalian cell entry related domain protein [Pedosphaera parvula Ellin514]
MSMKANPAKIGAFVVGGLVLLVGTIVLFGSGRFFSHRVPLVVYFSDSVNGLVVGAPVKFKGVPVGTVKRIQIKVDDTGEASRIPVVIEIDEKQVLSSGGTSEIFKNPNYVKDQINKGLRASLESESFITGKLYIALDYYKNAGPPQFVQKEGPYQEIPSISTGLSEFIKSIGRIDIVGISTKLDETLTQLNQLVGQLQVKQMSEGVVKVLNSADKLINSSDLKDAIISLGKTSEETRKVLTRLDQQLDPLTTGINTTTAEATKSLTELRQTLEQIRGLVGSDSPLIGQIDGALQEFSDASRSVRILSDYLARNPKAILTGKKGSAQLNEHPQK